MALIELCLELWKSLNKNEQGFLVLCIYLLILYVIDKCLVNDEKFTYQLNVSNVELCRQIVQWSSHILNEKGINFIPTVYMKYYKSKKYGGLYVIHSKKIFVYLNSHHRNDMNWFIQQITHTTLHEVAHHIQNMTINKFSEKYSAHTCYEKNPYEIEANQFARKHLDKCIKHLCEQGVITKVKQ